MPVKADLNANQVTIVIDFDATDLFDQMTGGVSKLEVIKRVYQRAQQQLSKATETIGVEDVVLDKRVDDVVLAVAELKDARPSGTLDK